MRQIRFRIWDKDEKRMSGPDGLNLDYCIANHNCENCDPGCNQVELMQFTGRQINGVDLYEGDILKGPNRKLWVIEWLEYGWWVNNSLIVPVGWAKLAGDEKYPLAKWLKMVPATDRDKIEIIGNIYELPHLLTANTKDK